MPYFLIAESEDHSEREERRRSAGKSSAQTFADTLRQMVPNCRVDTVNPSEQGTAPISVEALSRFDAVFLSGSPVHVYVPDPRVERQLAFMRDVFASGTPSFGSCAGLQVAVAAAGGTVRKISGRMEAGIARRITATDAGRSHPLLAGRPLTWDAPTLHGDEVCQLPQGATLLASNAATRVQAAEVRYDRGVFWGVQYHPELTPGEIGHALRRQADNLIDEGLAASAGEVEDHARWFDALGANARDNPARWRLGVDDEFACEPNRRRELRNFLDNAERLKAG